MANDVGSITASLKLESAAFIREMNKAAQATARSTSTMQRSLMGLEKSFASIGTGLKSFVAGFVGLQGLRSLKSIVDTADDIGAASTRLGIAAEELQRFRFAAEQTDVSVGQLDAALALFQRNLAKGKVAAEGATFTERFLNFIQRVRDAPTDLQQIAVASQGVGKQFQVILALAREGPEAFREWMQSATVFSEEAIRNASDIDNAWRAMTQALSVGFGTGVLEGFGDGLEANKKAVEEIAAAVRSLGQVIGYVFRFAVEMARFYADELRKLPETIKSIREAIERNLPGRDPSKGSVIPGTLDNSLFGVQAGANASVGAGAGLSAMAQGMAMFIPQMEELAGAAAKVDKNIGAWKTTIEESPLPEHIETLTSTLQEFGDMAASAFADAIVSGEKFSVVIKELLADMAELALNQVFKMLFANIIGGPTTAGTAGTGLLGGLFHGGGIVGAAGGHGRLVPAAAFAAAPRFHNGFMPDEMPAILRRGEGVFTPEQMRAMGGNVTVNIIDKNDSDVKVSEKENANGGLDIEVLIDQVAARKMGQPGSSMNRMLNQFGVRQPSIRR